MISFAPGPVPSPEFVRRRLGEPLPHHRTQMFRDLFAENEKGLQRLFGTSQTVLTLTMSGTGAMETASRGLIQDGDTVLVIENGIYGEQWTTINRALKCETDVLRCRAGSAVRIDDLEKRLKEKSYAAVFVQACETSTGVLNPIEEIARLLKGQNTLLIVDACSALGAVDLEMDRWGIDVLLTSSQKVLMCPPGLAFISLSSRAWLRCTNNSPVYFDLRAELKSFKESGMMRFTPAVGTIAAVSEVLARFTSDPTLLLRYRERMIQMHDVCIRLALGFGFSEFPEVPCPTLSVILLPPALDGVVLRAHLLSKRNVFVLGGFGAHATSVIRIGLMGSVSNNDLAEFWNGMVDAVLEAKHVTGKSGDELKLFVAAELRGLGKEVWTQ